MPRSCPTTNSLSCSGHKTSKLHLAVDGLGRPLGLVLTGGNVNDCTRFTAVMGAIRVPRSGPGRPRRRHTERPRRRRPGPSRKAPDVTPLICGWRQRFIPVAPDALDGTRQRRYGRPGRRQWWPCGTRGSGRTATRGSSLSAPSTRLAV
ncbi:transposase [Streptomyces sp. NPDC055663]